MSLLLGVLVVLGVLVLVPSWSSGRPAAAPRHEIFGRSGAESAASSARPSVRGFVVTSAWKGFTLPTAVRFASNGLVFVAQQSGIVDVFRGTDDVSPAVAVDLRTNVDDYWDRGLLSIAPDPAIGTAGHNYLYVLYTYDAPPGGTAPVWNDTCPGPPSGPGPTRDGCVASGRLSRIPIDPATGVATGPEQPLISSEWCQQFPSHSVGDLRFGPDGALYVSAGEGASFGAVDYGQFGGTVIDPSTGAPYTPVNPCGDPPGAVGIANTVAYRDGWVAPGAEPPPPRG